MAIALDSSSLGRISPGTTGTFNHTCTGSNLYMFAVADNTSTAITYNGTALTKLTSNTPGTVFPSIAVWGLASPATGTHSVSVTNNSGTMNDDVAVVTYTGADPTQPDASNTVVNNSETTSLSVTTITDNSWLTMFIKGLNNFGRTYIAGASTTLRQAYGNGTFDAAVGLLDSNGAKTPVGSYSQSAVWDSGSGDSTAIVIAVKPYLKVTLTGPASGNVNAASTDFTLTPDVAINGTVTITPSGGGLSTPTVLTFSNSAVAQTFTITPTDSGVVTLTVTNSVGLNNSSPLSYTANAVVPSAPTIGTATAGNTTASITFTDNSNGGSAITNHTATSTPGSFTGTSATSPITVTGLSNGTGYTFVVKATNAIGDSSNSSASNSVTPYVAATSFTFTGPASGSVRSASTNFTVTPNAVYDGTITITPSGAGSTGLSPVVLTFVLSSAAQTFTITPLASGSITLTPTNSRSITNPSNLNYTANAVVPLAPSIGLASASLSSASVSFSAPSNDGGSAVTLYTVTSSPGGLTATSTTTGTVSVLGLTNGTPYTFTVKATNAIGQSAASSASNSVTPTASSTSFTNNGPKFNIDRGVGNLITF